MKKQGFGPAILAGVAGFALTGAAFGQTFNEVEDNNTKAQADAQGTIVLGPAGGQFTVITGTTTGTSTTTAGLASADTFRIKTAPAPLGIYRHTLTITTTGTAGHTGSIRGLAQTSSACGVAGVATPGSDVAAQSSSSATNPARSNTWFGFGREEELYYRVTGTSSTTQPYTATYTMSGPITPIQGPTSIVEGSIVITTVGQTSVDTDMWLYDASFNPIGGAGNDDEPSTNCTGGTTQSRLTRTLTPGTYYLAISRFNLANDQTSPADEDFRTGNVLDFPNAVLGSSTTTTAADFDVSIGGTVVPVLGAAATGHDVQFVQFTVLSNTSPTPPTGVGVFTPNFVYAGDSSPIGSNQTLFTVTATPGNNPPSTGITVTADLQPLGGGATEMLFDNGTNGDVTAGDNVFSRLITVPNTVTPGATTVTFTVSDAESRSSNGSANVTVRPQATVTPLGTISSTNSGLLVDDASLAAGQIRWFSFELCQDVAAADSEFFDVVGSGAISGGSNPNDTEIGIYRADGSLVDSDDDDGVLAGSALSYGTGSGATQGGTGTTDTTPVIANGRDGAADLTAGTYYIAIANFNTTFGATAFNVTTTGAGAGTVDLSFNTNVACGPVGCDSIDFNGDGLFPDNQDLQDFLDVFGGGTCSTGTCGDLDFNNDGLFPDNLDLEAFFSVFGGGPCL
ncbi:MAG TPA: choice-of-anchor X domain-containing protein [Phycisphaerales bacterium]|nr:choice-of-anchor X domain-containing protein [Phycisphaerales bacterium]